MYTITYNIYGQDQSMHVTSRELAATTIAALNAKGAHNVNVSCTDKGHELKEVVEALNLAEQLELIERFKNYIKHGTC